MTCRPAVWKLFVFHKYSPFKCNCYLSTTDLASRSGGVGSVTISIACTPAQSSFFAGSVAVRTSSRQFRFQRNLCHVLDLSHAIAHSLQLNKGKRDSGELPKTSFRKKGGVT